MTGETQPVSGLIRRGIIWLPLIVSGVFAAIFLISLYAGDPAKLPSALVGKPVPDFRLRPLENLQSTARPVKGFSSETLHGNKVSLVNIWASWCVPCRAEHPFLMDLAKRTDIQLLGFNYKDRPDNARRFLGAHGNPYSRVGVDPTGREAINWGIYGVPETFIVDEKGIIRFRHVGPITQYALKRILPAIEAAKSAR